MAHEHHIQLSIDKDRSGKKVISHAREVLPNAGMEFCVGANNALHGDYDESTLYQENSDFKAGYWHGKEKLCEKYILK
ncbi:hypothetical protein [uncultured Clostridium sp.]|uniref:hypothetical protein n=1 Tax=uncultured Clostridium sp. TaxID=59620 RepID=UPI002615837F|nr:hypothetical protein [uncultured Clostridium sp.]